MGAQQVAALRLEVRDWAGPWRWRWVLTGPGGNLLADHEVALDVAGEDAAGLEAFADLEWHLRWRAVPDRRLQHEAELLADVGDWVTRRALGPGVTEALAKRPGPVHLVIPAEVPGEAPAAAQMLAFRPWQAARVGGRSLAAQKVTFVTDLHGREPVAKRPVGERLRMLAVFSLPEGMGALNLRRERYELARLVNQIATANNRAVELRVLQYGATRDRLEEALLEAEGWDILHVSGHGLPAGLVLEDHAGNRDQIDTGELVDLIDAAGDRLKFISLSACESAALTAKDHLRLLGLGRDDDHGGTEEGSPPAGDASGSGAAERSGGMPAGNPPGAELSALATGLVDRLDVAVLAMRYPVVDGFAIGLAGKFYDLVLGKGQPVDKALGLALPRVIPAGPIADVPALSVVTPALFGAAALGLQLEAPRGRPVVFEAERVKLARFPDQPRRFVGRVGAMTRAATALAPESGTAGVVFHGMAGAGKTACALELAYTHQDSFQVLVWHQASARDQDVARAFTALAMDLEAQVPGLKLLHLADDVPALTAFLPTFTQFLETNRVLLVLDNLESLLTSSGGWRDDRWRLLLEATTNPSGSSRVILTSRTRPAALPEGLRLEAVHALSLQESALLAREWPHLKALVDTPSAGQDAPGSGRGLAARVLQMVQGHPKLIELADGQAQDPAALAARLDEVDQTWLTRGIRLQDFLDTGEPQASDQDYYQVLDTWTRSTAAQLPAPNALLFTVLAGLEDDDRAPSVLDPVWPVVWSELGHADPAPGIADTLRPLVEQALVAVETDPDGGDVTGYRIHPGIAETTRAHTPTATASLVDTTIGHFWQAALRHGLDRESEGMGWLILHAARSAAPYLARRQDWDTLHHVLNQVLIRDTSPDTAAALLPFLQAAADATTGTDLEIRCGYTHARALARLRPTEAETRLRRLVDLAHDRRDHIMASIVLGDLVNRYQAAGRLEEALTLIDQMKEDDRLAGHGPWTQLADEAYRLQVRRLQGHNDEVLEAVDQVRDRMADLPDDSGQPETIQPWNVRENVLNTGMFAARGLELWEKALDLNADLVASKLARGAADREIAFTRFNDYGPLRALGRLPEARALLLWCREVFDTHHDITNLGKALGALADIEDELGHGRTAIDLQCDALRLSYSSGDVAAVGSGHHNLGGYLEAYTQRTAEVWAHRLAGALIAYQTGSGSLADRTVALARMQRRFDEQSAPRSFEEVCAVVDQIQGVHLAPLMDRLPRRAPDGQAAMTEVLAVAAAVPVDEASGLHRHLQAWEPVISALAATLTDPPGDEADGTGMRDAAAAFLTVALDHHAGTPDWAALVGALRRVQAGERDPAALSDGLDEIDVAILHRTLAALDGSEPIDLTLWNVATAGDDGDGGMAHFLAAMVAAAEGDLEAAAALGPLVDELAADPDHSGLADALRRILAGEREPATLTAGLDEESQALVATVLAALTPRPVAGEAPADGAGPATPTGDADDVAADLTSTEPSLSLTANPPNPEPEGRR